MSDYVLDWRSPLVLVHDPCMMMHRFAPILFLVTSPCFGATIEGDTAMSCRDLAYQRRIDKIAGAGDKEAVIKLIEDGLRTGQCRPLKDGMKVRIEDNSFPYACVTPVGSINPCEWIRQRNVNPKL